MADRYEQAAREIFDTHIVERDYSVAHLPVSKLYEVETDHGFEGDPFWVGDTADSDKYDSLMPISEFIDKLNLLQPDEDLHLEADLVVEALTKLWDFRCTVRAN